jgi:hypothetical protein
MKAKCLGRFSLSLRIMILTVCRLSTGVLVLHSVLADAQNLPLNLNPLNLNSETYYAPGTLTNCSVVGPPPTGCTYVVWDGGANVTLSGSSTVVLGPGFTAAATSMPTSLTVSIQTINSPPVITTTSLPNGTAGSSYSETISATGGTGSLTWSANGFPGLTISSSTGALSGAPAVAGTESGMVTVMDTTGLSSTKAFSFTAGANSSTIGTSSYLQSNFSFIPVTYYGDLASSHNFSNGECPMGTTVGQCYEIILRQLAGQGVTGVRVFLTFCDASSLAFAQTNGTTMCGLPSNQVSWNPSGNSLQNAWLNNLGAFFLSLQEAGISNIHITTGASAGDTTTLALSSASSPLGLCSTSGNCCPDASSTITFNPLDPYGYNANGNIIGDIYDSPSPGNNGYNCSPINPYFIGWTNYLNVIDSILAAARGAQLNVFGLEIQQEVNPNIAPPLIRYFYDNSSALSAPSQYVTTTTVDLPTGGSYQIAVANILSALRAQMSVNGFDPGRVVYSSAWTDASTTTENCMNAWDDYARNWSQDGVTQTINMGDVGQPEDYEAIDGLTCSGTLTGMQQSPIYSTQPDIVDIHMYPSVVGVSNTGAMIQSVAELDYGDVPHFLTEAGLGSAAIVIGETYGGALDPGYNGPYYCWATSINSPTGFAGFPLPMQTPAYNVAGFNSSSLASYPVTFRPWMQLEDPSGVCFPYGSGPGTSGNYQTVNYIGQGPYTPTLP